MEEIKTYPETETLKQTLSPLPLTNMGDVTKELYYYVRDIKNNRPVITICLLQNNKEDTARGIALCSKKDMPVKKIGRLIAKRRALRALKKKARSLPIKTQRYPNHLIPFKSKSQDNPLATIFEEELWLLYKGEK